MSEGEQSRSRYPEKLGEAINDYGEDQDFINRSGLAREVVRLFIQGDQRSQQLAIEGLLEAIEKRAQKWRDFDFHRATSTYLKPEAIDRPESCPDCSALLDRVIISQTGETCAQCGYSRF